MRGSSQGEHFGGPHDGPPGATQRTSRFVSAPQGGPAPAACFGHKSGLLARPPWPLKTARGALKTAFARRVIAAPQSTPKAATAASAPNPPFSRAPSGCHRRASCGPAVERAAIGGLAKGVGARCRARCRGARRRPRRGRCFVPAEGHGGVLLRPLAALAKSCTALQCARAALQCASAL